MRKFAYGIGLLCSVIMIGLGFYASYRYDASRQPADEEQILEAENPLRSSYHIGIHEGKVIVRLDDGSTYETTDISWDTLPETVQSEIEAGYILESKQELYSFLENYSS